LDGIEELAAVLRQTGKLAYVGYQMRFHPCLRRVRELLSAGSIGSPLAVKVEVGEYLPAWHPYEDYRQSYAARSDLGGGTLLSQIHEMDYLYWFFGLPKRVFCLGGHLSSLEVDVEDVTSTLLEFEWQGKTLPVHLQQDFVQRPPVRTCVIVGDAGKLIMDLNSLLVTQLNARGEVVTQVSFDNFQRNQLFIDQTTHFLDCVEGRARPLVSLEDGISSLRMALAARQSLATGQIVEVGP
jgi:predicted dehydrogenase